jgi:hypothetical protein
MGKSIAGTESNYKRLLRFYGMKGIEVFCEGIFMLILSLLKINSPYLIMDRTNWKIGKKNVNIPALGVLISGVFIPLCWRQLDKRGNSNSSHVVHIPAAGEHVF